MKKIEIKEIIVMIVGIILFVISSYISLPFFIGTRIQSRIILLLLFALVYGIKIGAIIGFLGLLISDAIIYHHIYWSFIVAEALFGAGLGLIGNILKLNEVNINEDNRKFIFFILCEIILATICWVVIAPILNIQFYGEPTYKVILQGLIIMIINSLIIAGMGYLIIVKYHNKYIELKDKL